LENWLSAARICFHFAENFEFSFECNVDSLDVDRLSAIKEAGINRPILGVQSFSEQLLKSITRPHNPRMGHQVIYHSHVLGFKSFGVDMLFGLPGETNNMFHGDMGLLIDMEPPHVSLYQLTIEPGTPLAKNVQDGLTIVPDEHTIAAMYSSGAESLLKAGYEHYEISSFARPGHECRHNLNYWTGGEYIGLGPSAHSYYQGKYYANVENVGDYIQSLAKRDLPRVLNESALLKRADDAIASGLRLKQGIDKKLFLERFGIPVDERLVPKEFELLVKSELLIDSSQNLRTSDSAFFQADEIARRIIKQ
jgi:oxygen-independent coproporphyrinogen-3 oxidase